MRRYLATDGLTGYCPDWYALIQAAKYLGVAPMDLLEQPVCWQDWAHIAMTAEYQAQELRNKHQRKG